MTRLLLYIKNLLADFYHLIIWKIEMCWRHWSSVAGRWRTNKSSLSFWDNGPCWTFLHERLTLIGRSTMRTRSCAFNQPVNADETSILHLADKEEGTCSQPERPLIHTDLRIKPLTLEIFHLLVTWLCAESPLSWTCRRLLGDVSSKQKRQVWLLNSQPTCWISILTLTPPPPPRPRDRRPIETVLGKQMLRINMHSWHSSSHITHYKNPALECVTGRTPLCLKSSSFGSVRVRFTRCISNHSDSQMSAESKPRPNPQRNRCSHWDSLC